MSLVRKKHLYTSFGAIAWLMNLQFYIAQIIVANGWPNSNAYSLSRNTISDLGNTFCSVYGNNYVCSPLHTLMNASFVILGCTMILGAYFLIHAFGTTRNSKLGFVCFAAAGTGTILVGLFPENADATMHIIGTALPFLFGNIGLVLLGTSLKQIPRILSIGALLLGVIALAALILFMNNTFLGIGIGNMERIVAYPQTIWMILFGYYVLGKEFLANPAKS